jgi:hypothetical protein
MSDLTPEELDAVCPPEQRERMARATLALEDVVRVLVERGPVIRDGFDAQFSHHDEDLFLVVSKASGQERMHEMADLAASLIYRMTDSAGNDLLPGYEQEIRARHVDLLGNAPAVDDAARPEAEDS